MDGLQSREADWASQAEGRANISAASPQKPAAQVFIGGAPRSSPFLQIASGGACAAKLFRNGQFFPRLLFRCGSLNEAAARRAGARPRGQAARSFGLSEKIMNSRLEPVYAAKSLTANASYFERWFTSGNAPLPGPKPHPPRLETPQTRSYSRHSKRVFALHFITLQLQAEDDLNP
jgi:hypothetical protein